MARLKLNLWDSVISDCEAVLSLPSGENNIKAHYYLSQAHLELSSPASALPHALRAHALCAASNDKSLAAVTAVALRCKKEKWLQADRLRRREDADLERNVLEMLQREADADVDTAMDDEEKAAVAEEAEAKKKSMVAVFERAREAADRRREPPDWLIDDISFCVLVDPVMVSCPSPYVREESGKLTRCADQNRQVVRAGEHHRTPATTSLGPADARAADHGGAATKHCLATGVRAVC